jgi:hypothetical protein
MRKPEKSQYRVRNWREYNAALGKRGSLEVWVDEAVATAWESKEKTGERGCPEGYRDSWIELILTLGMVYHQPLRQVTGFAKSLVRLSGWTGIKVPHFTTLCRRRKDWNLQVSQRSFSNTITVVVDSSGAKVYGEGAWKVKLHGKSKRRTWRKFHLAVEPETLAILALEVSTNDVTDDEMLPAVLKAIDEAIELTKVCGDGGYDRSNRYQTIKHRKAKALIPPRKDAKLQQHGNSNAPPLDRDQNLRRIRKVGRKRWKQEAHHHQRSLAETSVYRYKATFGSTLNSRLFPSHTVEIKLGAKTLNRMSALAMPDAFNILA